MVIGKIISYLLDKKQLATPQELEQLITNFPQDLLAPDEKLAKTALHVAVADCSLEIIKLLVKAAPQQLLMKDNLGFNPLEAAAQAGKEDVVSALLSHYDRLDSNIDWEQKAAQAAAVCGNEAFLTHTWKFSLQTALSGQQGIDKQIAAFFCAVYNNQLEIIKNALAKAPELYLKPIKQTESSFIFPLQLAATKGHLAIIQYFLQLAKNQGRDISSMITQLNVYPNDHQANAFHQAASFGHLEIVDFFLVQAPNSFYIKDSEGDFPLEIALMSGQLPVARYLLNVIFQDKTDEQAKDLIIQLLPSPTENNHFDAIKKSEYLLLELFYWSIEKRRDNVADYLFELCAKYNETEETTNGDNIDDEDDTLSDVVISNVSMPVKLIDMAIKHNYMPVLKYLLTKAPQAFNDFNRQGYTPLQIAVINGFLDATQCLIEHAEQRGEDLESLVKQWDNDPLNLFSTLQLGIKEGHEDIVRYLLDKAPGAIDAVDHDGFTALQDAAFQGQATIARYLLELAQKMKRDITTLVTESDNIVNYEISAFSIATKENEVEVLKCLLEFAPRAYNTMDKSGIYPIQRAVEKGAIDTFKILLDHAKLYDEDKMLLTQEGPYYGEKHLIYIAAEREGVEIVEYLLRHYPESLKALNRNGYTPLQEAVNHNNLEVTKLFFNKAKEFGMEVSDLLQQQEAKSGDTLLHLAARANAVSILSYLYTRGLRTFFQSNHAGLTPIVCAIMQDSIPSTYLLLSWMLQARIVSNSIHTLTPAKSEAFQLAQEILAKLPTDIKKGKSFGLVASLHSANPNIDTIVKLLLKNPIVYPAKVSSVKKLVGQKRGAEAISQEESAGAQQGSPTAKRPKIIGRSGLFATDQAQSRTSNTSPDSSTSQQNESEQDQTTTAKKGLQ